MKNHRTTMLGLALLSALALGGCSHAPVDQQIDQKLQAEPEQTPGVSMGMNARQIIENAGNLSESQRQQLLDLQARTSADAARLREESYKLRSVLIKEVLGENYREAEVRQVKQRLEKVMSQRLTVMFKAVDEANRILGRNNPESEKVIRAFQAEAGHARFLD